MYPHVVQYESIKHEAAARSRMAGAAKPSGSASRFGGTLVRLALAVVAVAAVLASLAAGSTDAAPKPGFLPGTWIGKGVIKGFVEDGPMATHFDGGIAFTMKVSPSLAVSGSGTWRMNMLGSQDAPSDYAVDSTMMGTAAVTFGGPSTAPTFAGTQKVVGEIRSGSMKHPISMERPLSGKLTIGRAGKCLVRGVTQMQRGVTLTWSAQLKGSGKCRA